VAVTETGQQAPPSPFLLVAYGLAFTGAAMLVLTPFLPLAHIELLGESIETRESVGGTGWGIVLCGLIAAAFPAAAIVRRNPVWATGVILPAIVAIGWSGYYTLSKVPDQARLADSASLAVGGMLFVFSGPVLMIAGLAAMIATYARFRGE
jgi:hypothetical protein